MEKNKNGIFYATVGVATLIVAIIGATFAYFTASASNNNTVSGTAASAGLNLTIALASPNATGPMVPQKSAAIATAYSGTSGKLCVDGNGNTVCKVYTVTLANTGSSSTVLYGAISFAYTGTGAKFDNLKWSFVTSTAAPVTVGTANAASATATQGNFVNGETFTATGTAGATKTYTVIVWINETDTPQNETDKGTFTGTIAFNSATGSGVTSTFVA